MASDANEIVIFIDPDVFFSSGPPGPAGPQGATWHNGDGPPDIATGNDGDYYLDNLSKQYYYKESGTWTLIGTLSGTEDHNSLYNRDGLYQHPISAITDLQIALDAKLNDDAPIDGATYGQKDGQWEAVVVPKVEQWDYVIAGTGAVEADVNATDFTNEPNSEDTWLIILPEYSYRFSHNGELYAYVGPKNVTIGVGGNYVTLAADYESVGTLDHTLLTGLDAADQHPISSITGLQTELDAKALAAHTHVAGDVTVDMTNIDRLNGPGLQDMLEDIDELVRHGSAFLYQNNETLILTAGNSAQIVNYLAEDDISGVADPLLGSITLSTPGVYDLTAHVWLQENADQKDWTLALRLFRGINGNVLASIPLDIQPVPVGSDNEIVVATSVPIIVSSEEVFVLALQARGKSVTVNLSDAIFSFSWRHD